MKIIINNSFKHSFIHTSLHVLCMCVKYLNIQEEKVYHYPFLLRKMLYESENRPRNKNEENSQGGT